MKKTLRQLSKSNLIAMFIIFLLTEIVIAGIIILFLSLFQFDVDKRLKIIEIVIAAGATLLIILELRQNKNIHEADLIMQLNMEFIENQSLSKVEQALEKYYYEFKTGNNKDKIELALSMKRGSKDRQLLTNYLVHLEAIASLVNSGILRLNSVTDLTAYRYFIAVNNPIVQKELYEFKDYYSGCFSIYKKWSDNLKKHQKAIPMEENHLL